MFSTPSPQLPQMPKPTSVAMAPEAPTGQRPQPKGTQPTYLAQATTPQQGQKGTQTLLGSAA